MDKLFLWRMQSVFIFILAFLLTSAIQAGPVSPEKVPEALKPWVSWVLHDKETGRCPMLYNQARRECQWPARLVVDIDEREGRFTQTWLLYAKGRVALPGSPKHWPQQVTANGNPVPVTGHDGVPGVFLQAGQYTVEGRFAWDKRPEFLQLPGYTGLIALTIGQKPMSIPNVDEQGRLWLRGSEAAIKKPSAEENRLEARVYRLVSDNIPLRLITRLELDVAGRHREISLGPLADPKIFIPMSVNSPLPARLEADGRLRIQVRPGSWVLRVEMRRSGETKELSRPAAAEKPWPEEEVWVFKAQNRLRLVEVSGVSTVDPQQTGLPAKWKRFPAYRMRTGEVMLLEEKRRGDPEPAPDQLHLKRQFWLDFDGQGYTVQDHINGSMTSGWRLEMAKPASLGRVSVQGKDQLITRLGENSGVEVRRGNIALEADSRIEQALASLPAVGWLHDFQSVSAALNLPPGWRLLYAAGVDDVPDTWIEQWNLLNLFLVLITALAIAKLWDWRWGALALLTLVLIYHEPGAPQFVWLNILAAMALLRVLPEGKWFTRIIGTCRNLGFLVLLIGGLLFMVQQVRQAIYPQLEHPWLTAGQDQRPVPVQTANVQFEDNEKAAFMAQEEAPVPQQIEQSMRQQIKPSAPPGKRSYLKAKLKKKSARRRLAQIDPEAQVQTGPGLPHWQWTSVPMNWNGPVKQTQQVQLYLLSPLVNSILGTLRASLVMVLTVFLLWAAWKAPRPRGKPQQKIAGSEAGAAAAVLLLLFCAPWAVQAAVQASEQTRDTVSFPAQSLLDQLQQRLLAPPDCLPGCAANPAMRIKLSPRELRIYLEIHAQADTAAPLPGLAKQWLPQQVWLDGQPARGLLRGQNGHLWLNLDKGVHQVQLAGPLPARNTVQLALPLTPRHVQAEAAGWRVEGLHENGLADKQLQFTREQSGNRAETRAEALETGNLPAFVQVERTLSLGLDWQVETRVRRLTPPGAAIVLKIPLLAGESVTSEIPRVEAGQALINLSPHESQLSWVSVFAKQESITLTAPDTNAWSEVWRLDASAVWHVEIEGIAVVHHQDSGGHWLPEWRPWPGENITLHVTRPAGIGGQVMTMDASKLQVSPGQRATDNQLSLNLRSSRGGQHRLTLPEDAELQSVKINGAAQPIRQEGRGVTLPLTPGAQRVDLLFRQPVGVSAWFYTPAVDLGNVGVNAQIEVKLPNNRWILFTSGPAMGPAVLFWGVLAVLILVSIGLGRIPLSPVKSWQWFLLGLVISQFSIPATLVAVAWFMALGWRQKYNVAETAAWKFNLLQISLAALTLATLSVLFGAIQQGLLGHPDMQILGNGSSRYLLRWYQDRIAGTLPQAQILSLPLMVYRLAMLAWALWLAFALLRWLRWGWECFSAQALWKPIRRRNDEL
ncbi:MAG: hypothetical protein GY862_32180 [Gammaproteobacteria bacterium]|nr:hypothetical protein [Gammaproteobacteria bacterium]